MKIYTKHFALPTVFLTVLVGSMGAVTAAAETHSNLQSVTETGASAWNGEFPFTIRGVITAGSDEMLDSTPNYLPWDNGANSGNMGAEWQTVIQAVDEGDFGGTFLWLGQNYGNQPWIRDESLSYTNEAWLAELSRVMTDPDTGRTFQVGDYVEVTARKSLFYGGKRNINEAHNNAVESNFDIQLVTANYGLPEPAQLTLSDLVLPDETNENLQVDIFDATRNTGGEHYQGMRVRLNGLKIVEANGWDATGTWAARSQNTVTDGANRFFKLRHPRTDLGTAPTETFDAIGIINQESGSGSSGMTGYELFVQEIILQGNVPTLALTAGTIRWESKYGTDWVLESADTINGTWAVVSGAPILVDDHYEYKITTEGTSRFYRLKQK